MNPARTELEKLHNAIYLEKVERARRMTPEERFMEGMELSNEVLGENV